MRDSGKKSAGKGLFATKEFTEGDRICTVAGRWVVAGLHQKTKGAYYFKITFPAQARNKYTPSLLYETLPCQAAMINDFKGDYNCKFDLKGRPVQDEESGEQEEGELEFAIDVIATRDITKVCSCSIVVV